MDDYEDDSEEGDGDDDDDLEVSLLRSMAIILLARPISLRLALFVALRGSGGDGRCKNERRLGSC
jgi:hypothetical protein